MVVSVQGYNGKKSKATQTACCIAGMLALAKGQKTLLLQLTKKDINNVENTFLGTSSVSAFADLSLANTCIDSLLRSVGSTRMSVDDFDQNVTPLIRNVKNLLDITENTNDVNFDLTLLDREDDFVNIVESAKNIYENIILLAMENDCETLEMINENADLSIYCITQGHKKAGHAYGKKIIYLVTDYEPSSAITLKSIRKQYKESGIMAPVNVYKLTRNVSVRDASINGTLLRFIRDNKNCQEYDRNYAWYQDMETICNLISDAPMDEISSTEWEVVETRIRINGELGKELKIRDREPTHLIATDELEENKKPEVETVVAEEPEYEAETGTEMETGAEDAQETSKQESAEKTEMEEEILQNVLAEAVTQIKNPEKSVESKTEPSDKQEVKENPKTNVAMKLKKGPRLRRNLEREDRSLESPVKLEEKRKITPERKMAEDEVTAPVKRELDSDALPELEYERKEELVKETRPEKKSVATDKQMDTHETELEPATPKEEEIHKKPDSEEAVYEPEPDFEQETGKYQLEAASGEREMENELEYAEETGQNVPVEKAEEEEPVYEDGMRTDGEMEEDSQEPIDFLDLEDLMMKPSSTKAQRPAQQPQVHKENSHYVRPEKRKPPKETEKQKKYHAFIDRAKANGKTRLASMSYEEWVEFTEMNS